VGLVYDRGKRGSISNSISKGLLTRKKVTLGYKERLRNRLRMEEER